MNKDKKNNKNDCCVCDLFDFNHDGKLDVIEWRAALGIRNTNADDEEEQSTNLDFSDPLEEKEKRLNQDNWQDELFEGDEYGIDPDDYETEEEYVEAVEEAIEEYDFDTDSDGDWSDGDSYDSFDGGSWDD